MGAHHRIDPADVFVTRVRVRVVVVCCCLVAAVAIVLTRIVDVSVGPHSRLPAVAGASTVDATNPGTEPTGDADTPDASTGGGGADGSGSDNAGAAAAATDAPGGGGGAAAGTGGTANRPAPSPGPVVTTAAAAPVPAPSPSRTTSATPTPSPGPSTVRVVSYEAESSGNTLTGTRTFTCAPCSGGRKVGDVGDGTGVLQFNKVNVARAGTVTLSISYVNGDPTARKAQLSVDGGPAQWLSFPPTGDWNSVATLTVKVGALAGDNTVRLGNPGDMAPDFDRLTVRETS